jgi:predicted transcriptional regulator
VELYFWWNCFVPETVYLRLTKSSVTVPGPEPSDADEDLLLLVKSQPGSFATAPEIEPETDVGEKQTRNRLEQLHENGLLHRRRVGSTNVYWLTDEGEATVAPSPA